MKWNPQHLTVRFPSQQLQYHWVMAACKALTLFTRPCNCIADLLEWQKKRHEKYVIFARGTTESCSKGKKKGKKNKQEWATSNKLQHVLKIKQKGQKVCHNKNKLTGQNYVRAGSCCIHLICTDYKWPSWQSNSSQSHDIFLVPKSPQFIPLVCIFLLYIWKQMTAFWLNIKIKNIYSDVNKSQKLFKRSLPWNGHP